MALLCIYCESNKKEYLQRQAVLMFLIDKPGIREINTLESGWDSAIGSVMTMLRNLVRSGFGGSIRFSHADGPRKGSNKLLCLYAGSW